MMKEIQEEIKHFLIASFGIIVLGLSITLLSWQYTLISSGLPGYGLIINYLTKFPLGTLLIIANSTILFFSFVIAGKTSGIRGVYGYIFLSLVIDYSKKIFLLKQIILHSFAISALLISFQGFIAPIAISVVILNKYSFGSYSSLLPIFDKIHPVSPPKLFLFLDAILVFITFFLFGFNKAFLLAINALVFFVVFKYSLKYLSTCRLEKSKLDPRSPPARG